VLTVHILGFYDFKPQDQMISVFLTAPGGPESLTSTIRQGRWIVRKTVIPAVLLITLAGLILLPRASVATYPCEECRVLDFGWLGGKDVFCVFASGYVGANSCYSGDGWCYTSGECVIFVA